MTSSQEIGDPERPPLRTKASFIGKMFGKQKETISKQPEDKHAGAEYEEDETIGDDLSSLPRGLKQAAVVRPLGNRLQARWAGRPNVRPAQSDNGPDSEVSGITKARLRAESFARLEGRISDEQPFNTMGKENLDGSSELPRQASFNHGFGFPKPASPKNGFEPGKRNTRDYSFVAPMENPLRYSFMPPQNKEESKSTTGANNELRIEDFATMNGIDQGGVELWKNYLQSYTEGQYNLGKPPKPPTENGNFKFLPAFLPPNEGDRQALCAKYDILWPHSPLLEGLGRYLIRAERSIGMQCGSLSFFDNTHELIKIENGYPNIHFHRETSISAHVLYSSDVMVVLDTQKDWRFANHPLVTAEPKIRFFAGAPLLSTGGEVMGALSVFSREPQVAFTPHQRAHLADLSKGIVSYLDRLADYLADTLSHDERRDTPLLDRDSGIYKPGFFSTVTVEPELMPSALQCPSKPLMESSRGDFNYQNKFAFRGEPTPPSSSESHGNGFFDLPQSFGKNYEQISEDPILDDSLVLGHQADVRVTTPRPFSSSDITSLYENPSNTPDHTANNLENFFALSDNDCAECIDTAISICNSSNAQSAAIPVSANPGGHDLDKISKPTKKTDSMALIQFTPSPSKRFPRRVPDQVKITNPPNILEGDKMSTPVKKTYSMALIQFTPSPLKGFPSLVPDQVKSTNPQSILEVECKDFADRHDFDVIYCVELKPSLPNLSEEEILAEKGMKKRILILYGQRLVEVDSKIHLHALRVDECLVWRNEHALNGYDDHAVGYLATVHAEEGPPKTRRAGVVLGVFRRPRLLGQHEKRNDREIVSNFARRLSYIIPTKSSPMLAGQQTEPTAQSHSDSRLGFMRSHNDPVGPSSISVKEPAKATFVEHHGDPCTRKPLNSGRQTESLEPPPFPANEATEVKLSKEPSSRATEDMLGQAESRSDETYPRNMDVVDKLRRSRKVQYVNRIKRVARGGLKQLGSGGFA